MVPGELRARVNVVAGHLILFNMAGVQFPFSAMNSTRAKTCAGAAVSVAHTVRTPLADRLFDGDLSWRWCPVGRGHRRAERADEGGGDVQPRAERRVRVVGGAEPYRGCGLVDVGPCGRVAVGDVHAGALDDPIPGCRGTDRRRYEGDGAPF